MLRQNELFKTASVYESLRLAASSRRINPSFPLLFTPDGTEAKALNGNGCCRQNGGGKWKGGSVRCARPFLRGWKGWKQMKKSGN